MNEKNKNVYIFLTITLASLIGFFDYWTGSNIDFGVMYLIPIIVGATIGRHFGLIISAYCALMGLTTDIVLTRYPSEILHYLWDFGSHLFIYVIVALSRSKLLGSMQHERELARTDNLTGAINTRAFYELLRREIDRLERYGHFFTLVYIDLDNFKIVNDQFGHVAGDQALQIVVDFIRGHIRRTDIVARLGGDEFAMLLPETRQEVAHVVISNLRIGLLEEMRQKQWPITFSIGVLTCQVVPPTVDALVYMADELMYLVKREGKDGIKSSVYAG